MDLFLLRHAIAVDAEHFNGEDSERPLTADGARKMRGIAKGMRALGLSFDIILSSPYRRAHDTARMVATHFRIRRRLRLTNTLTPCGNRRALIEEMAALERRAESVLLVGHEPYLSTLASTLVFGRPAVGLNLKKGGLCKLTSEHVRHGRCAELEYLLTPRQLMALAS